MKNFKNKKNLKNKRNNEIHVSLSLAMGIALKIHRKT